MKETYFLLQTYEIFLKIFYFKFLQENLNNEIIGFTDCENNEETAYYTVTDTQGSITEVYNGSSFISEDPARDDSKSYYDNSFSFLISKTVYENALNFVNKASPKYNLYTNNCVDFAIKVADKANVKLPEFGIGSNPSTLNDELQLRDLWRKR